MSTGQAFKYPECQKGEFHKGEALSLVCIQPKCIENSVICGICLNEDHKNHKIKPLKIVINNSRKYIEHLTPLNIDSKSIIDQVNEQKKSILAKYDEFEKTIIESIANIKQNINAVYIKITQKIDLKTGSKQDIMKTLDQIKQQELQHQRFISLMKKLLAGVPQDEEQEQAETSSKQIKQTIASITKKIEKDFNLKSETIKKQMTVFSEMLKKLAENPGLFNSLIEFKFSKELKHNGIQVVSDNCLKSIEAYNYHFGLMQPGINEKGPKKLVVAFHIKQCGSNWVAVGLCNKNIVQANSYQFNYSSLGHGGYLISSNGGSWSSFDSTKNNVVNSFSYGKGDTVIVSYIPNEKKILFKKKGTESTHILEIDQSKEDDLHLCCLFYYNNDQIEYMGPCDQN